MTTNTPSLLNQTPKPCTHPRANHQHGHYLTYRADNCRCTPCKTAHRRHTKLTAYRTHTGTHTYTDATPTRQHIQTLLKAGMTISEIENHSGVHRTSIRLIIGATPNHTQSKRIKKTTSTKILQVHPTQTGTTTTGLVNPTGTRRRLQALVALGYPIRHLYPQLGMSSATLYHLISTPHQRPILATTRDKVTTLYLKLENTTPPPSQGRTYARNHATRHGWLVPAWWDPDTIDNPNHNPLHVDTSDVDTSDVDETAVHLATSGQRPRRLTRAERWTAVQQLAASGHSDSDIAHRLGVSDKTVLRDRHTHNIPPATSTPKAATAA